MATQQKLCIKCERSVAVRPMRGVAQKNVSCCYCLKCWNTHPSNVAHWSTRLNPRRREWSKWYMRSNRLARRLAANAI